MGFSEIKAELASGLPRPVGWVAPLAANGALVPAMFVRYDTDATPSLAKLAVDRAGFFVWSKTKPKAWDGAIDFVAKRIGKMSSMGPAPAPAH